MAYRDRDMEIDLDAIDGVRVHIMARMLGIDVTTANGYLVRFWKWSRINTAEGDLAGFEPSIIADGCAWTGDPMVFVAALYECGPTPQHYGFIRQDTGHVAHWPWFAPRED